MGYRISLHLLATVWHLLLMGLALSLRKTHRYYAALIPLCLFSGAYSAAWGIGLALESEFFMRLTWIGAMWPAALLFFIREIVGIPTSSIYKRTVWTLAIANTIGGFSPYTLLSIKSYESPLIAEYGPMEPFMRILLFIQIALVMWNSIRHLSVPLEREKYTWWIALIGFSLYGVGAFFTSTLLPLLGDYRSLESTSYGSVIWSTFAVWLAFKELRDRNQSLLALDSMKRDLINHVTHEFKTPLSAISSAVEIIGETSPQEKAKRDNYLSMIQENSHRLSHFVNELLDLAAIQQAKISLKKEETDLYALLEKVTRRLTPTALIKNVSIRLDGAPLVCLCDEEKIEQVLSNLISNSLNATPGGQVLASLGRENGSARLTVSDNGSGIAREHLDHIFSSFYRVAIKNPPHKGTGLGLAVAKGWVEAHGGKIWAESDGEGKGTKVTFTLPI